jgi:hypothetical protein
MDARGLSTFSFLVAFFGDLGDVDLDAGSDTTAVLCIERDADSSVLGAETRPRIFMAVGLRIDARVATKDIIVATTKLE